MVSNQSLPTYREWWTIMMDAVKHMSAEFDKKDNELFWKRANSFSYIDDQYDFFSASNMAKEKHPLYYWNRGSESRKEIEYPMIGVEERTLQNDNYFTQSDNDYMLANLRVYVLDVNDHKNDINGRYKPRNTPETIHDTLDIHVKFLNYIKGVRKYRAGDGSHVWLNKDVYAAMLEKELIDPMSLDKNDSKILRNYLEQHNTDILIRVVSFAGASALFGIHFQLNVPHAKCIDEEYNILKLECREATIQNTTATYVQKVKSGGVFVIPDVEISVKIGDDDPNTFTYPYGDEISLEFEGGGVDVSDANADEVKVLEGATFYASSPFKRTGTMPNIGNASAEITTKAQEIEIQEGYHNGIGKVKIAEAEQDKIIPENIKAGVTVLGVSGELTPSAPATNYTTDVFTSSGQWNKPANHIGSYVILIAGGGGGGSGRRGALNSNREGGIPAVNSRILICYIASNNLSQTEDVVVGAGGVGGEVITTDNTTGLPGSAGGSSFVRDSYFLRLNGATGGNGGATSFNTTETGQNNPASKNSNSIFLLLSPSQNRSATANVPANNLSNQHRMGLWVLGNQQISNLTTPASHGGSISSANIQALAQNSHGYFPNDNNGNVINIIEEIQGASEGQNGIDTDYLIKLSYYMPMLFSGIDPNDWDIDLPIGGAGGGCGDLVGSINAGNATNGRTNGGGGGGGGASTNGANSGRGGDGANGLVIFINILN